MMAAIDMEDRAMAEGTRIALVTGGGRGLGRSTALALARRGTDLVLTWREREDAAAGTAREIASLGRRAVALRLDTAEASGFGDFAARLRAALREGFGRERFEVLVNNAGSAFHASFAETPEAGFDRMMREHLKGPYFLTQALLPLIADGGRIVNLSTGLARFTLPGFSAYAAMKGGVEVMTRYMAKELGPRRIAVNAVAPGAIETDFGGGVVRDNPEMNRQIAGATALGRAGVAEDIGPIIAALASEEGRWVNGQRIEVSGGAYL
jgi:NAD(P)-dependent dehydrogenase (short-subunit alcohol dehydrogenase family)